MRFFGRSAPIAGLVAAAALALGVAACSKPGAAISGDDMTMGNAQAKVTVVEYASASCPHCAEFNNDTFPAFKAKYIDTGKIHYVFREFITPPPEVAVAGFLIARCAGKDKYFSVLDAIYHGQQAMYASGDYRGSLLRIAESAGMTEEQFNSCTTNDASIKALNDRVDKAVNKDGITGTPTFVVNGAKMDGAPTLANLDAAIAAAQAH
jgi:protein-disulfide isomerase